jgi:hypothetical protein
MEKDCDRHAIYRGTTIGFLMRSGLGRQKKSKRTACIQIPVPILTEGVTIKTLSRRPRKKLDIKRPDFIGQADVHLQEHLSNTCTQLFEPLRISCLLSPSNVSLFHQILFLNTLSYRELTNAIIEIEKVPLRDYFVSYHASIAMDACVGKWVDYRNSIYWGTSDQSIQPITCYRSHGSPICCAHTLPDYFQAIHSFTSIDPVSTYPLTPLARLMSKVTAPLKCRGRKFQGVFNKTISTYPVIRKATDSMVLCSLLGNYPHCGPDTRPGLVARISIHALMGLSSVVPISTDMKHSSVGYRDEWYSHIRKVSTAFRSHLYNVSWKIMVFVYREYGIWIIDNNPALKHAMEKQFNYPMFREMVIGVMDKFRLFIRTALLDRTGHEFTDSDILSDHEMDPDDGKPVLKKYEQELDVISKSAHTRLLKTTFRRAHTVFLSMISIYHTKMPSSIAWAPKGRPVYMRLPSVENDTWQYVPIKEGDTKINRQILSKWLTSNIRPDPSFTLELNEDIAENIASSSCDQWSTTRPDKCVLVSLYMISIPHTRTLNEFVRRFPSTTAQRIVILSLLSVLPAFGTPNRACDLIWTLIKGYDDGSMSKSTRADVIKQIHCTYPYTYNILAATASMWEHHTRIKRYKLPLHYWKNQLEAITSRCRLSTDLSLPNPVPISVAREHLDLSLCSICLEVYSLTRDFSTVPKRPYYAEYNGKYTDTILNKCYCSYTSILWNSSCQTTELSNIMLLGHVVIIKSTMYMLCPQRGCGMVMIYNPVHCAWNERGPACSKCTETLDGITETKIKAENSDYLSIARGCVACKGEKKIAKSTDTFLYGPGTYICRRHNSQRLVDYVTSQLPKLATESQHIPIDAIIRSLVLSHQNQWAKTEGIRGRKRDRNTKRMHRKSEMDRLGRYI